MSNTQPPLVSIITPVYNGEAYLRECIESVLRQTYQNWEYIIVNNQSEDATLTIAEEYARGEPRIRVITNKEFVGQVANQNIGIRQMSSASEFCKMLHADDWLYSECVEKMVELAMANPSVGIVSAYTLWGMEVKMTGLPYWRTVIPGREIAREFLIGDVWVFGNPTTTMIRSGIVRSRESFYDEDGLSDDTEACFDVTAQSDVGFVHQVLTFTRLHEQSVTSRTALLDFTMAGGLRVLLKYGPVFLTPEELRRQKRKQLRDYYSCLARRAIRLRGRAYWRFHSGNLRKFGMSINYFRVAAMMPVELAKLCFSLKRLRRVIKSLFSNQGVIS